jgi:hypothetical protein
MDFCDIEDGYTVVEVMHLEKILGASEVGTYVIEVATLVQKT